MALYISPDYQTSFESVNWVLIQEKKFNIDFQDGSDLGFPIRPILATLDLKVTLMLSTKLMFIGLSAQEKKRKLDLHDSSDGKSFKMANILDFRSELF